MVICLKMYRHELTGVKYVTISLDGSRRCAGIEFKVGGISNLERKYLVRVDVQKSLGESTY